MTNRLHQTSTMHIFKHRRDLRVFLDNLRKDGKTVGFVPTMGALHAGHVSLIELAKEENDVVVCSIFVNPIQFNDKKDLENYPRPINADIEQLINANCTVLFNPEVDEMFPEYESASPAKDIAAKFKTTASIKMLHEIEKIAAADDLKSFSLLENIDLQGIDQNMEGKYRPGHFKGVMKVVYRLFDIVQPNRAYFGEKDFQQLAIIKKMVESLALPIDVVPCPIKREEGGLAMSSRNLLLTEIERTTAAMIFATLSKAKVMAKEKTVSEVKAFVVEQINQISLMKLEYFEVVDDKDLKPLEQWNKNGKSVGCIALFLGKVRLIDNIIF
jgi:pantoate--beta-alanine ligase